ncbi:hypothetical protein FD755_009036, partial [Muntiacus reevesi]
KTSRNKSSKRVRCGFNLDWEDTPDEEMATHSSILVWEIPWTEKHGRLQSTASQRKPNMKRQNGRILKEELPRSVGAQYATGDQRRNNSRMNEGMESKQKQYPVVDVTGDRSKVRCCKEQYCIGTWNVRSMNQGKLEVVKQEMARMNVDILGISKLKWTGMGEFNSDDHYIYYCGQESLRRNGVAIIVNNRVRNAVLGCNLKNNRMISVRFQGKPFNIMVIQAYAPTSNAEEAEVEQFYEDLQDLLELTPKKDVLFIIGDWNAKVGSQETPGVIGKLGLGVWNEAGQRLIEFCQENTLVIANTLFQQHKRRLYTWTSSDGQHRNQINYIFCSQRCRSSIQSEKTRPGADCGSDHELLIAKFRLKLKKVGITTRPFIYADDTTLMAESEELKSLLMKVKEETEKTGLKLNIQKTKIMASGPITSWEIDGETSGLPFPSPGDFPDPGIKPASPALQADSLPSETPGKPKQAKNHLQLFGSTTKQKTCQKLPEGWG